jgi:hypothetical protein
MIHRSLTALLAVACTAVLGFIAPSPALAQANKAPAGLSFPIQQGQFNGTLRITSFGVENNQLVASGIVTGTVGANAVAKSVTIPVTLPTARTAAAGTTAAAAAATCGILHLELGPLDLDLLGLVVHLDRVVLDLSAAPGAGNLLGNLLCSITNLLNGAGTLAQIANLLNQLLGLLG